MDLLYKLGIDSTFFYQLAIFCVTYVFLSRLVFKPYLKSYEARVAATTGFQENAEKLREESQALHQEYEAKAQEVNTKVQSYFESANKEAQTYQATTMEKVRKEAASVVLATRKEIESESNKARSEMKIHIAEIGKEIQKKILSKDLQS